MMPMEEPMTLSGKNAAGCGDGKAAFARRGARAAISAVVALCLCSFAPFAASAGSADAGAERLGIVGADDAEAGAEGPDAPQAPQDTPSSTESGDAPDAGVPGEDEADGAEEVPGESAPAGANQNALDAKAAQGNRLSFDFSGIDLSRGNGHIDIDGVSYPLSADGAIELPEPIDAQSPARFATFYVYNDPNDAFADTSYPTAMYVWELSYDVANGIYSSTRLKAFDNALKYAGCSVRAIGKTGIRIVTEVPKPLKSALCGSGSSGYRLLEYGTAVQWDSTLQANDDDLTLDTTTLTSSAYNKQTNSDPIYKETSSSVKYTGVLVGFSDEAIKRDLSIRPYMKLVDDTGRVQVLYGGVVHRSIGYIASQNYNAFGKGTVGYNFIWRMIHLKYGEALDAQLGYVNWDIRAHVPELFQNPELPWGCESVSLVITLRAMGYNVGKTEIYDSYMSHSSWDYVNAFAGDAYNKTGIGEAYPPAIVAAANRYLATHGAAERAVNLSGASFSTLLEYIDKGYPVLVWTTMYMREPKPWGMSLYGYRPYGNEHCVVMYGHSGGIQVSDPLSGKVTRDYGAFASLYERCGYYAAVIV